MANASKVADYLLDGSGVYGNSALGLFASVLFLFDSVCVTLVNINFVIINYCIVISIFSL